MTAVNWVEYDGSRRQDTTPKHGDLVWIVEEYYEEGVTLGFWDVTRWCTWTGSDDCHVTHWAEIEKPEDPR